MTQGTNRFLRTVSRAVNLSRKMDGPKGYILIWSIIFMTFGTMVTMGLVAQVAVNLRGTGQTMENAGEYYTADAGTSAVVADAMLGKDVTAPSYTIPIVDLNNRTADIVINTPVPGSGSADVYHYFDPGASGDLNSLAAGAHYIFEINSVLAQSAFQVNWAFTPTTSSWDITVHEGSDTKGTVVAKSKGKASPGFLSISAGQLAAGTYTVDFYNTSSSTLVSALYSAQGGLENTWVYTGNGIDNRAITGVGFAPDVVIIKGDTNQVAVLRTSTMSGDSTKPLAETIGLAANMIQSLNADGFTLGTNATVNRNGVTYYWMAFKAAEGNLKVGSYSGNGIGQSITGLNFSPAYVIAMSASSREAVQRASVMPTTFFFDSDTGAANRITSLDADGFTVGDSPRVNTSGTTYYYVA